MIYQICDGDVPAGPDSYEPDSHGTEVPDSPALPKDQPVPVWPTVCVNDAPQDTRARPKSAPPPVPPRPLPEVSSPTELPVPTEEPAPTEVPTEAGPPTSPVPTDDEMARRMARLETYRDYSFRCLSRLLED